ncbi:MAG: type IV pilus secretin PilQ [Polyangiaceae bacterium]|nr:type IV pilus secretin PilQ [Polyangiaceae bacterium]
MARPASAQPAPTCRFTATSLHATAGGGAELAIVATRAPDYALRVAEGGLSLAIDVRDAAVDPGLEPIVDPVGPVSGVLVQGFDGGSGPSARILVRLSRTVSYRVEADASGLRLRLEPADRTAPAAGSDGADAAAPPATVVLAAPPDGAPSALPRVAGVRFEHGKTEDRVIIELSASASYTEVPVDGGRSIVELRDVALSDVLARTLDTTAFGGAVRAISCYRRADQPGRVRIDVDHASGARGVVSWRGTALHWVFGAAPSSQSSSSGVASDGGAARRTKVVAVEPGIDMAGNEAWQSEPNQAGAVLPQLPMQPRRNFTGRRIDLDLKDADIHNVLRMIADVGNVNIVTADNVDGTVSIRMRNVPWDQALDTVLQAKKLGMVRQGNIIRVALMEDLNKERELALARRKSELELAPIETRLIPVSYAQAAELQDRAKDLLSPRGSIAVDERTNVLVVRDVAGNLNQIEELTRALDTQTPQVLIEARIVEATSRFQRDVGIQWGGDATFGTATGNETGITFPSNIGLVGGASDSQTPTAGLSPFRNAVPNPNFAVNLPATVGTGQGGALGITLGSIDSAVNLSVRLSAAEASGMLRIVSSPRILTLDNSEARISQGTLIPFSQVSAQGVQTVFQEAKLQLYVKPHVTADGSVSMHVKINRDEPDFNQTGARGDPTILKREAETDLLVQDGHTAVIGGIYTRNSGRNLDQVPLLGDIPILGVLFQRRRSSDTRSELVIFLTPRIVNRAESLGR